MNRSLLDAELKRDEGERLFAYDDADGSRLVSGHTVRGTPTCGVGCNLTFLYPEESFFLLRNRQDHAIHDLTTTLSWFMTLDEVRQRALVNLYFNIPAFLHWPKFMGYCESGAWAAAADELETTRPWIDQVGARGRRIAQMLRTGTA